MSKDNHKRYTSSNIRHSTLLGLTFLVYAALVIKEFQFLISSIPFPSEDLPAHIALIERLKTQLSSGRIFFFDTTSLSGWPAFSFYAFGAHFLIALSSIALSFLTDNPVVLATNLWILTIIIALPLSLFYASIGLFRQELLEQTRLKPRLVFLTFLSCCLFSLWLVNHDEQFYGIGVGSIVHTGLLPQGVAWHLLLVYLGCLTRIIQGSNKFGLLALVFAALFLTHTMTAVFAFSVGIIFTLWSPIQKLKLTLTHLCGFGLTGFWLLPFLRYSGDFTLPDPYPPQGDFFTFMFRYPLQDLWRTVESQHLFSLQQVNLGFVFSLITSILALTCREIRKTESYRLFFSTLLLLCVLYSSEFVAASIPLGIHYYRVQGYLVFLLLIVLSAVPALTSLYRNHQNRSISVSTWRFTAWILFACASIVSITRFPTLERIATASTIANQQYKLLDQVLEDLRTSPSKGRVLVEFSNNYQLSPYLSAHYLAAKIPVQTGRETISGLFVESSITARLNAISVESIGGSAFSSYLISISNNTNDVAEHIRRLHVLGVTQIVATSSELIKNLMPYVEANILERGPYRILTLTGSGQPLAIPITRPIIGFYDQSGALPFYLLEFYFGARKELSESYELVQLTSLEGIPANIAFVIVNSDEPVYLPGLSENAKTLQLRFFGLNSLQHYERKLAIAKSIDRFSLLATYLDSNKLSDLLAERLRTFSPASALSLPQVKLLDQGNKIELTKVSASSVLRLNYSYFPLWKAEGAKILRGTQEQIFLFSEAPTITLSYSYTNSIWAWLGLALSMLSIAGVRSLGRN